ncbi:hypothetical protein Dsin_011733 [Dipteronia sinensis]|uniref:PGG domain-containing protein n=1 Tax=Dipteronia sinensis TaxID=43782 RepID=A0AAE0E7A4_9ROSI|nr:hypothetical protein Dsin_011733 [Dipteronia sinensis]
MINFLWAISTFGGNPTQHERLLNLFENESGGIIGLDQVFMENIYGNTVLHEAAISGNLEAVKILVSKFPKQVNYINKFGETPLFRAAAFGKTKVVKYLAYQKDQLVFTNGDKKLQNIHRQRKVGTSILHAAVQGEHFEMEFFTSIKEPYQAVLDAKWEDMNTFYIEDPIGLFALLCPISVDRDTAFHLAVYSGSKEPLKSLLEFVESKENADINQFFMKNIYGNTVLHEAAISGNLEAVQILVSKFPKLVKDTNEIRETPLFRAAAFGKTKIVKYLASQPDHMYQMQKLTVLNTSIILIKKIALYYNLFVTGLPVGNDHNDDAENIEHKEEARNEQTNSGGNDNGYLSKVSNCIYPPICRLIIRGSSIVREVWKAKRYHIFAHDLAMQLIEKDESWEQSIRNFAAPSDEPAKDKSSEQSTAGSSTTTNAADNKEKSETTDQAAKKEEEKDQSKKEEEKDQSPLFAAAKTGNTELVKMILKEHPQALEYKNRKKQNILHVAVKYRQKEIFNYVKKKTVPMLRLVRQIDEHGYTILHSVADTKHYIEGTGSGPAYQLQEELEWFNNVDKLMPTHYRMFLAIVKTKKTTAMETKKTNAMELFKERHADQLKKAQAWIKETSQSCSGVAVLVATVVFAAAFTVPGGTSDSNGRPILLHSPLFLFFTITDVVSLSCSLTAVVMFLSIVTSPFELDQFLVSLPRRLTLGFALLFMSVATTMLAFTSTIFLIIHLDHRRRQWTMTLICSAAFFPVSVLALTHFPLFVSFIIAWKSLFKFVWKALPCNLVLGWLKKLGKTTSDLPITDKGK